MSTQLSILPQQADTQTVPVVQPVIIDTPDQALEQLTRHYHSGSVVYAETKPVKVQLSPELVQTASRMASFCRQRKPSTKRFRHDADQIHLLNRAGCSIFIGQSPEDFYQDWYQALGRGNGGVAYTLGPDNIGLRGVTGDKTRFTYWKNRRSGMVDAFVFSQLHEQHNGQAFIQLLGWAYRGDIRHIMVNKNDHYTINLNTVKREGLLLPMGQFRDEWQKYNNGGAA